jgi:hypothetical protein
MAGLVGTGLLVREGAGRGPGVGCGRRGLRPRRASPPPPAHLRRCLRPSPQPHPSPRGDGWGDKGFIRMRMGRGKAGLCGIASQPSYPLKSGPNPPAPAPGPTPPPKPAPGPAPAPPKPDPEPVECDDTHECPAGSTCCCLRNIAGLCFTWGCCPMPDATCCSDHVHCCPSNLPVCDVDSGRCLPPSGASPGVASAPWATKTPARRRAPASGAGFSRKGGRAQVLREEPAPLAS